VQHSGLRGLEMFLLGQGTIIKIEYRITFILSMLVIFTLHCLS